MCLYAKLLKQWKFLKNTINNYKFENTYKIKIEYLE